MTIYEIWEKIRNESQDVQDMVVLGKDIWRFN